MMRDAGEKNWRWVGRLMCLSTSMHNLIKKKKNKQILTYGLLMIWKKFQQTKIVTNQFLFTKQSSYDQ